MARLHGDESAPEWSISFLNSAGLPVVFCLLLRNAYQA